MAEIIPAILAKNYDDLKNKVAIMRGVAPIIQVDICDGIYVPSRTWPFFTNATQGTPFLDNSLDEHFTRILNEEEGMPFWEDIDFELDLMVADAVTNFDIYTKMGAKRIIFHLEAMQKKEEFRDFLEGIDMFVRDSMNIGVAINPLTPIEEIFSIIPFIDFVQCMGINREGFQGEVFDEKTLGNIKTLKQKFPEVKISVDGGVNMETAQKIIAAGADRLVAGSAIWNATNPHSALKDFENLS